MLCCRGKQEERDGSAFSLHDKWTLGVGDGQGGLACYGSWGHKELD